MPSDDDFASFMERRPGDLLNRLGRGEKVKGPITHIAGDSVFVGLNTRSDGRIPRAELCDARGELQVTLGQVLEATVVDPDADGGPLLAVTMGRDQRLDLSSLMMALDSGTPVEAVVKRAVKAGLEMDVGGARAFCPASQIERGYVADVTGYVGQTLRVIVTEVKEEGRSVIVSRRRVLDAEREQAAEVALSKLAVGQDLTGKVASIQQYGAFVDLGGVEGLVHISELSTTHVDRVEDVLSPGEQVTVRVLSIEDSDKGKRIRLSMKALSQEGQPEAPGKDEVLEGTVVKMLPHGVIVQTAQGQGLVPRRELALPEGADHRRALAIGEKVEVVLLDGRPGSFRFSRSRVDDVRAKLDFAAYRTTQSEQGGAGMGSLGALLGGLDRANLPAGPAPKPKAQAEQPKAQAQQPKAQAQQPKAQAEQPKAQAEQPRAQAQKPTPHVKPSPGADAMTVPVPAPVTATGAGAMTDQQAEPPSLSGPDSRSAPESDEPRRRRIIRTRD